MICNIVLPAAALVAALLPAAALAADRCPRSAALDPGPTDGPLYSTVAPFEHYDTLRTHLFPATCSLRELGGSDIRVCRAPQTYPKPYTAQTRERDELFVFSYGLRSRIDGAYVAAVDTETLRERWRTRFTDPAPGEWSWPGVVTVHGNGFLYAVYANRFVKLDPADGSVIAERILPEGPDGAVYNGMTILPDGRLATKGMESPAVCRRPRWRSSSTPTRTASLRALARSSRRSGGCSATSCSTTGRRR